MSGTVAILSGGMDSTTMLHALKKNSAFPDDLHALSFDYGQKHARELDFAFTTCCGLEVPHEVMSLRSLKLFGSSTLTDEERPVPDGHYTAEVMKATVVPNRNMVMLSLSIARCLSLGFSRVAYGAHSGDHTIYPDCRPEFIHAMHDAAQLCDWTPVALDAPFYNLTKAEIVSLGEGLGVPWTGTWSCYKGGDIHCGTCGTCVERKEAFVDAGVVDPTGYLA